MKTLEVDSLIPPARFEKGLRGVRLEEGIYSGRRSERVRPYWQVALLLAITEGTTEVLSPAQINNIENRAIRKLKRNPEIRRLYGQVCGNSPIVA